jgi:hypothetical protein
MELIDCIGILKKSDESNIQLDLSSIDEVLLVQVFKQKNVLTWNLAINNFDDQGLIIVIVFHKNNHNNEENWNRFIDFEMNKLFKKFDFFKQDHFFAEIPGFWTNIEIENFLYRVIKNIYGVDSKNIQFTLNAY